MVPGVGLEPTRCLAPKDFKSFASTDFATRAFPSLSSIDVRLLVSVVFVLIWFQLLGRNSPSFGRSTSNNGFQQSGSRTGLCGPRLLNIRWLQPPVELGPGGFPPRLFLSQATLRAFMRFRPDPVNLCSITSDLSRGWNVRLEREAAA